MIRDPRKNNRKNKPKHIGPSDDCTCAVCVFTKSQAPGQPYDIKDCPKNNAVNKKKKNK